LTRNCIKLAILGTNCGYGVDSILTHSLGLTLIMERHRRSRRLSVEAWDSIVRQLPDHSPRSLDAARLVLVEGKSQKYAYEHLGLTKQRVSQIVKTVTNKIEKSRDGWVYVTAWAPAYLAKEFQAKIDIAMMCYAENEVQQDNA